MATASVFTLLSAGDCLTEFALISWLFHESIELNNNNNKPCNEWVSELIYDRQSVGQYVLVSGAHLGPVTSFSFTLKFFLDIYGFVSL
jgi:hypothetical protein